MISKKELLNKINNKNVTREVIAGYTVEKWNKDLDLLIKDIKSENLTYSIQTDGSIELSDGSIYIKPKQHKITTGIISIHSNNFIFNKIHGNILAKENFKYNDISFTLIYDDNNIIKYTII